MTSTQAEAKIEYYKQLPLFGDAMSALIPLEWLDVSDYRPVPDNQEMFSDFNSESPSMVCVEIVERVGDNVTGVQSSSVREETIGKVLFRGFERVDGRDDADEDDE